MVIVFIFLIAPLLYCPSSEKSKVVVTIDDLPFQATISLTPKERDFIFEQIFNALKKDNIQAVCFVVGNQVKLQDCSYLKKVVADGHILANHTFSHPYYNSTPFETYKKDIEKCFGVLKQYNLKQKYFRFPYLVEVNTREKFDSVHNYLKAGGIIPVPVSLPCFDYEYNPGFEIAYRHKDIKKMDELVKAYLEHTKSVYVKIITLAKKKSGRPDPPHIAFFHINLLNAYCITELLNMFRELNMTFASVDTVLREKEFARPHVFTGTAGLTHYEKYHFK